jgi:pyrimidine oxygenase
MDIGVFLPIGNNGWLVSTTSPQYMPTFDLNRRVVQKAEGYGLDFVLSMIKLRGFGGATEFWDFNLESFTLMAGLAAVTDRIQLYASVPVLILPPPLVARMAVTIDSIAPGRFGVNIVSGWNPSEYEQMGLWPGPRHFERRYDYCREYVAILKDLWTSGRSDFKGEFLRMDDCQLGPLPSRPIKLVCAGQSDEGIRFSAECTDFNFSVGVGRNTPMAVAAQNARLVEAANAAGTDVGAYSLFMVIADETDHRAQAKWRRYGKGIDLDALQHMTAAAHANTAPGNMSAPARSFGPSDAPVNMNMGTLIGSYEHVASMLDEVATIPGTKGAILVFDDFLDGLDAFGNRVLPLMKCRA